MTKNIIEKVCKSENEAQEGIANLKCAGFERTQNCYWVEWWEKNDTRFVVIRDF